MVTVISLNTMHFQHSNRLTSA